MTGDFGPGTNTGHGHVWPRPDGARMRCGGPGLCPACAADAARLAGRGGGGQAAPALRWEETDADGSPVWSGYAGTVWVASAWQAGDGTHRWSTAHRLPYDGSDDEMCGPAPTSDGAKAAARCGWVAWAGTARLWLLVGIAVVDAAERAGERR